MFITTSAVSSAEGSLGRAMNFTILENRSTMVTTVVFPCETGSPVTKLMEMSDHGLEGMGSGCRSPVCALEAVLFRAQTEQAEQVLPDLQFHCWSPEPPGYDEHGSFDFQMA